MLNCSGDTDCKVNVRTNFVLPVWPTCKSFGFQPASTTAREHLTVPLIASASSSRILKLSGTAHSTAAGYEDLSVHDIYSVSYSLNDVKDLYILAVWCEILG